MAGEGVRQSARGNWPSPLDAALPVINHLLKLEPWARERLQKHADQTVALHVGPVGTTWQVLASGFLQHGPSSESGPSVEPVNVTLRLPMSALPAVLAGRAQDVLGQARIEGDIELAQTLGALARELRWDAEHDLGRVLGPTAAYHLVKSGRTLAGHATDTAQRLTQTVAEYWVEESPLLVRPITVQHLADGVRTLKDDLARLEKRLDRLSSVPGPTSHSPGGGDMTPHKR